jgi:hypothetical protein
MPNGMLRPDSVLLDDLKNPRINVMASQALECPIFNTFIGGRHAHQFHLPRAFWTSWHQVNVRDGWDTALEFWHSATLNLGRERHRTLSHRRLEPLPMIECI